MRAREQKLWQAGFGEEDVEEMGMELGLNPEERDLLKRILTNYLSNLRMEIVDTENYDWRQDMKRDETIIKALISRLDRLV